MAILTMQYHMHNDSHGGTELMAVPQGSKPGMVINVPYHRLGPTRGYLFRVDNVVRGQDSLVY